MVDQDRELHKDPATEPGRAPGMRKRRLRSRFLLPGRSFSYALDINLTMMAGVVCRTPTVAVVGGSKFTWTNIKHIDQGHRRRGIKLPIRFEGALAGWAHDNLDLDDQVVVVGRLWMGQGRKGGQTIPYTWCQVERASVGMPVQLEADPNFVRVRVDMWNRLCMLAGDEHTQLVAPEVRRRTVPFEDVTPYHLDEEVESMGEDNEP